MANRQGIRLYPEELKENYDKMSIVMIYLNQKLKREKGFFDMMNTLLSLDMDIELKKQILCNEYQIPMEKGFVRELSLLVSGYIIRYTIKFV